MLVFAGAIAAGTRTPFSILGTPILWMRSLVGQPEHDLHLLHADPRLPVAEATTLIKSYPIWVAILSWVVLRDRPSGKVWSPF